VSEPPTLIDSHCHIAEPEFDHDRDAALARAAAAGVTTVVCVGAVGRVDNNGPTLALAGHRAGVRVVATVGIHPHDAATADDAALAALRRMAATDGVVGLGETGLDYHYEHSPRAVQRDAFARTAALARDLRLPLVVHVRDAHADAAALLRAEPPDAGGVIHCFTGDADDARRYLDLGLLLSISGIVTFRNADALRQAVRLIPRDRLLVETDAPFLSPVPHRGKRNEPAHVRLVADAVGRVRGEPLEAIAEATTANARRFFRLEAKKHLKSTFKIG
jgi:TatD DNase family protein